MRQKQFTSEQIIAVLQEGERGEKPIAQICREHRIAVVTFYRWRRKYAGLTVPEAQRLRELERENGRLKRLLAERDLAIDALQEYFVKK